MSNTEKGKIIVGRTKEKQLMEALLYSEKSELLAMYGRRRVGKTFLIRNLYSKQLVFEMSGSINADKETQLFYFADIINKIKPTKKIIAPPKTWPEAFVLLIKYIETIKHKNKKVLFFDELPWLDGMHSGFLSAFDYFWNSWAVKRTDLLVIICGSSASWMIHKIIYNKGGLHNRITQRIQLPPFTLAETEEFLKFKGIDITRIQVAQTYMVTGGIPFYLDHMRKGKGFIKNIDLMCFTPNGILVDEFDKLYESLYHKAPVHISVVRALFTKRMGMTRTEILKAAKIKSGGQVTKILMELQESGFIEGYIPLERKTKDVLYRLTDEYSLFYLKFIEPNKKNRQVNWDNISKSAGWSSWSGYAFENVCIKHIPQIKKALEILNVNTQHSAWRSTEYGVQIDLLIKRADKCINLFEIKFSDDYFEITKKINDDLNKKRIAYKSATKTNDSIFMSLITVHGAKKNKYYLQQIDSEIVLDNLFVNI